MTISGPAVPVFCMYLVAAERQGVDLGVLNGTLQTDIFKEYIAQKEWLFAARAAPAPDRRPDGVLRRRASPTYKPLSRLRLPHPRGRLDGRAGARVHPRRRLRLRRAGPVARPRRRRRSRPACRFFFDAHLDFFEEIAKFRAARRIWARWMRDVYGATDRQGPVAAVPHPDRRGLAHRPAAVQQRRPHRRRGARRRARRHQLAAHQRPRRDARAAHRAGRRDRAAHPAGAHGGDRRRQRRRPARRLLVRRGAHRPDRGRGRGDLRPDQGMASSARARRRRTTRSAR